MKNAIPKPELDTEISGSLKSEEEGKSGYKTFPFRLPEANVQAELYHQARLAGYECVMELPTPVGRFDVTFMNEGCDQIVCIVECKHEGRDWPIGRRQLDRYESIGVPVYTLNKRAEAADLVARIISEIPDMNKGVSLDLVMNMPRFERARRSGSQPDLYARKHRRQRRKRD